MIKKMWRVTVTVETFDAQDIDKDGADSQREIMTHAVTDNYKKAMKLMSEALSQLDEDPLHGPDWS